MGGDIKNVERMTISVPKSVRAAMRAVDSELKRHGGSINWSSIASRAFVAACIECQGKLNIDLGFDCLAEVNTRQGVLEKIDLLSPEEAKALLSAILEKLTVG